MPIFVFGNAILLWSINATSLMNDTFVSVKAFKFEFKTIITMNHFDFGIKLIFSHVDEVD
jgi:hypothetical protein